MAGNNEPAGVDAGPSAAVPMTGQAPARASSSSSSIYQTPSQSTSSSAHAEYGAAPPNSEPTAAAGPSRRRSRAESASTQRHTQRPASPETAFTESSAATSSTATDANANAGGYLGTDPPRPNSPHLDIATYPTPALLRLLARILQQIASSNDQLRGEGDEDVEMLDGSGADDASNSASTRSTSRQSSQTHPSPTTALFNGESPQTESSLTPSDKLFTASLTSLTQSSSLLSFHARHVPSISIEAYLLRILKYCPTTNEVFLGLLVYFDRMSKLGTPGGVGGTGAAVGPRGFAIDSFNIHRLVIAGVTVASKFFSDVFYTNSRYAKVGGLPPHELNQLELQFLLLNDFRLRVPPEEMQKYADRLIAYWMGREAETGIDATTGLDAPRPAFADAMVVDAPAAPHPSVPGNTPSNPAAPVQSDTTEAPSTRARSGSRADPQSSSASQQPAVIAPPTSGVPVAPRGRERDRDRPSVSFAPASSASTAPSGASGNGSSEAYSGSSGVASGLRDWAARGDDGVNAVVAGRMSSPMRD